MMGSSSVCEVGEGIDVFSYVIRERSWKHFVARHWTNSRPMAAIRHADVRFIREKTRRNNLDAIGA
jgi:hypothetical protein